MEDRKPSKEELRLMYSIMASAAVCGGLLIVLIKLCGEIPGLYAITGMMVSVICGGLLHVWRRKCSKQ